MYSLLLTSGTFPLYEEGETHLLECNAKYGPIHRGRNYRRFLRDWLRSSQFARSGLDAEEFARQAAAHRSSYMEFFRFFMECMARDQGKLRWAEKTPQHTFFMHELAAAFPDAHFINVVRDGRDVALSMRRLGWSGTRSRSPLKQLLCSAILWERYATAARRTGRGLGARYLEIRYEDVVTEPDAAIQMLSGFCQANITALDVAGSSVGALGAGHSAFETGLTGISPDALYRWRRRATRSETAVIEHAVRKTLESFGYMPSVTDVLSDVGALGRASPQACRRVLAMKEWLKQSTPLGRLTACPLELQ